MIGNQIAQGAEVEVVPVVPNAPPQEQPEVPPAGVEVEVEEAQPPRPCGHKANKNGRCGGKGSRGCKHGAKIKLWMEEKAERDKAKKKAEGGATRKRKAAAASPRVGRNGLVEMAPNLSQAAWDNR